MQILMPCHHSLVLFLCTILTTTHVLSSLCADKKPEAGQKTNYGPDGYQAWKKQNEAGQRINKDSGPDSWQFWGPNRQLLNQVNKPEAGQKTNYGPDGYQAWSKQNEAGQRVQKDSGPDSWQFWGPNRQLLNKETEGESASCTRAMVCPACDWFWQYA